MLKNLPRETQSTRYLKILIRIIKINFSLCYIRTKLYLERFNPRIQFQQKNNFFFLNGNGDKEVTHTLLEFI